VRLAVLRRCVLESTRGPDECAERLRRATHRLQPPFGGRRPFVGRVSADRFSVRSTRRRGLPPRANGTFGPGAGEATEVRVELGVALVESIPVGVVTVLFALNLLGTSFDLGGLLNALIALLWLGMVAFTVRRWNRWADELVARLCTTCEAELTPLARELG
jgi:hypothetical protein